MTDASFSMAIMVDHRFESANAITFPPAPANMSINTVLNGDEIAARSSATLLLDISNKHELDIWGILRNWFRRHAKPSIVCHVNSLVICRKYAVALVPIPTGILELTHLLRTDLLLYVPLNIVFPSVVMAIFSQRKQLRFMIYGRIFLVLFWFNWKWLECLALLGKIFLCWNITVAHLCCSIWSRTPATFKTW